ncbi:MAG TPA: NUDIX domain-containing protein [Rectinemataceae bacterium]|nr:NUDIX domain-containing protein [Rectinemataceae bacterium]
MAQRSIAGIAIRNGRILVAKRKEGGAIGLMWEFPGGKVEEGESDQDALKREFLEEFGIEIKPQRLLGTSTFVCDSGVRELAAWMVDVPEDCTLELREHSKIDWIEPGDVSNLDLAQSDRNLLPFLASMRRG